MPGRRVWEWVKQGDGDFHANWHHELPSGVTLSSPSAYLHQGTDRAGWVNRTSEVTIAASIVDARDEHGELETGGTNRAIRVVITLDPQTQPDITDEPEPNTNYRVRMVVTRSDSSRPIARDVELVIVG